MEQPSDGLHDKQKHGIRYTSFAFGNGEMVLSCIDPDNNNNLFGKYNGIWEE